MYQAIAKNSSQILLKRLFIFLGLFMLAILIMHFYQSNVIASYPALNEAGNVFELDKNDIIFTSISGQ